MVILTELFEIIKRYNVKPFPYMMSSRAFLSSWCDIDQEETFDFLTKAEVLCCASK